MPKHRALIIGITGGIATGKSTVSGWLRKKGHAVICADEIAHNVSKKGGPAYADIIRAFGRDILKKDKNIDRAKLADLVFTNHKLKRRLEKIIHPRVRRQMRLQIRDYQKKKYQLIFLDIPLLFENNLEFLCDRIICISAPQRLQIERLQSHRQMTRQQARDRIRAQLPLKTKELKADMVIRNNGSLAALKRALNQWLTIIVSPHAPQ